MTTTLTSRADRALRCRQSKLTHDEALELLYSMPRNKHEWNKLMGSAFEPKERKAAEGQEPHYTPEELGESWGLSANTIRGLVENEPVVRITRPEKMHKRGYVTVRIPKSVADRVHAKLLAKGK